jgi:putative two-component system response regulator
MYVEIDGQPYSMEMVSKISNDTLMSGYGHEVLVEYISEHNEKLYLDPVTDVRNRRYYEEQFKGLKQVDAVALIDIDRFKEINDSYGHQVGDRALRLIAKAVQNCMRKTDAVVRYGGDEFVVVFREIPEAIFEERLKAIQTAVHTLRMPDIPGLRFSVSVGSVYGKGKCEDLLIEADKRMYWEKRNKRM